MFSLQSLVRALTACLVLGGIFLILRPDALDPMRATVREHVPPGPGAEVPKGSVPVKRQDQIDPPKTPAVTGTAKRDASSGALAESKAKPENAKKNAATPEKITLSRPVVVSSVRLKGRKWIVSLAELSAPDATTMCKTPSGVRWHCGAQARTAVARLILRRRVECEVVARVSDEEVSGRCKTGSTDINSWVVRQGWAKPSAGDTYDGPYRKARDMARRARLGLWRR